MRGAIQTVTAFIAILLPLDALSFSNVNTFKYKTTTTTHANSIGCCMFARTTEDDSQGVRPSMHHAMTHMFLGLAIASVFLSSAPQPAMADGDISPASGAKISIAPCKKNPSGAATNCVSTGNVRQLDLYAPPWTFEASAEEAAARIKGVIASDSNFELSDESSGAYLKVKATRNSLFTDNLEFLVNSADKVVTFRGEQEGEPSVSDFGAIRKELETIRQKTGILGVMGEGMTADTMPSQNGPLGQLKAFYGLQSGQGYEDVFED